MKHKTILRKEIMKAKQEKSIHSQMLSITDGITGAILDIFELMPKEDYKIIREHFADIKDLCETMIRRLDNE